MAIRGRLPVRLTWPYVWRNVTYVGQKQAKRGKSLPLAALKKSGALSATFHPDGSVASVVFGAAYAEPPKVQAKPVQTVEEAIARPFKTDLDALDTLPSYDDEKEAN